MEVAITENAIDLREWPAPKGYTVYKVTALIRVTLTLCKMVSIDIQSLLTHCLWIHSMNTKVHLQLYNTAKWIIMLKQLNRH